jgi:LAO/AO transport system kinase
VSQPSDEDALLAVAAVRRGDLRTCGRLITRVESGDESAIPILQALYSQSGQTPIIGITGPPGSGKSTLTDQLITRWRASGKRVAVLAVDPSSPFSGGAILGDRIRMSQHYADSSVFIRSMSARGRLGGLAAATGDTLTILDAMGFDRILIETVGIGQNEIDVMYYAHSVVILQIPGAGDVVQSIKAGVLEIGDIFVVNKADLPGADKVVAALQEAVEFRKHSASWRPPVVKAQSNAGTGIDELLRQIENHLSHLGENHLQKLDRLRTQARARLLDLVNEGLRQRLMDQRDPKSEFNLLIDDILERRSDPHSAAVQILGRFSQ